MHYIYHGCGYTRILDFEFAIHLLGDILTQALEEDRRSRWLRVKYAYTYIRLKVKVVLYLYIFILGLSKKKILGWVKKQEL